MGGANTSASGGGGTNCDSVGIGLQTGNTNYTNSGFNEDNTVSSGNTSFNRGLYQVSTTHQMRQSSSFHELFKVSTGRLGNSVTTKQTVGIGDITKPVQENILEELEDEEMNSNNDQEELDELLGAVN